MGANASAKTTYTMTGPLEADPAHGASSQLLAAVFEAASSGIFVKDLQQRFLMVNAAGARLMGKEISEMVGRTHAELFPPAAAQQLDEDDRQALAAGNSRHYEITADFIGEPRTYSVCKSILRDPAGKPTGIIAVVQDISDRIRSEEALRLSEHRFQLAMRGANDGVWDWNLETDEVYYSPRWLAMLGFAENDLPGEINTWRNLVHPEDLPRAMAAVRDVLGGRSGKYEVEYRMRHKDGRCLHILSRAFVDERDCRKARLVGTHVDITDRKRAEEEMRKQLTLQQRLAHIVENGPFILYDFHQKPDGSVSFPYCSPGIEKLFAVRAEELRENGAAAFARVHPEDLAILDAANKESARTMGLFHVQIRVNHAQRGEIIVEICSTPQREPDGSILWHGFAHEITVSKRAEEQLRHLSRAVEQSPASIVITDRQGRIEYANPKFTAVTGYSLEEVRGQNPRILKGGDTGPEEYSNLWNTITAGGEWRGEFQNRKKNGELYWEQASISPIFDHQNRITHFLAVKEDVTERKRAEECQRLEHEVTRTLAAGTSGRETIRNVLDVLCRGLKQDVAQMWTVDRAEGILRCTETWHRPSPACEQFAAGEKNRVLALGEGLPGTIWKSGMAEWNACPSGDLCPCMAAAQSAGLCPWLGFPIRIHDQTYGVVQFFASAAYQPDARLLSTLQTIGTQIAQFIEHQQLADRVRHAQKLEAIGTLAGGIAHDFNNVLAAVQGYAELAQMQMAQNPVVADYLESVLQGTARACNLVKQILAFSRQNELERKPLQLRSVVSEALKLLRATIPSTIQFEVSLAADAPLVLADPTQVHQVLMNLFTNAAHAMRGQPGRLTVTLEHIHVDEEFAAAHPGLRPVRYVRMGVSDTGHGMEQATVNRIFEPFFTTKPQGEGTGLGLSVVHGIMHSHEGAVFAHSRPGHGTTFQLYFPAHREQLEPVRTASKAPPALGRKERILLVDDESALLDLGKRILERHNYVVDTNSNAMEALAAVREKPDAYDVVITDQTMPRLAGLELISQLRAIRPDLPVILMTGYSSTLTFERLNALGVRALLLKPFSIETLTATLQNVLAEARTSSPSS